MAIGNDIQWARLITIEAFLDLGLPSRETNEGRRRERESIHAEMSSITHNFKIVPGVQVSKKVATDWVEAVPGTDYTATTNAALTITTIKNISGGSLDFYINVG